MASYSFIHGAGDSGWAWHLVERELRARGHETVAVDLPCEDDDAGWWDYADAVAAAAGERDDLVVVAHSLGGFTAPLVSARVPVSELVLVAAMVPRPGETGSEWWSASGYEAAVAGVDMPDDEVELFYNCTPPELVEEARAYWRDQSDTPMAEPWPLDAWPDVPTRYVAWPSTPRRSTATTARSSAGRSSWQRRWPLTAEGAAYRPRAGVERGQRMRTEGPAIPPARTR